MSSPAPDHDTRPTARSLDHVGVLQVGGLVVLGIVGPGALWGRPGADGMSVALAVTVGAFLVAVAVHVRAARTQPAGSGAVRALAYTQVVLGFGSVIVLVASLIG